jgi:hypothetical protein
MVYSIHPWRRIEPITLAVFTSDSASINGCIDWIGVGKLPFFQI